VNEIDPIEFGALRGEVQALRKDVEELSAEVKELLALANKSKGALWLGMMLASGLGAAVHWLFGKTS
jgi:hypothetical protein